ncbi:glutamate ligase domain-containing protein [Streptomyces sp. NPDC090025]|uniref:glutamate ligase domain-containing protein n=1 Tax=Streptomyces sp. NPDC090025 TaxID=3365922 RepID=UPI003836A36F
MSGLALVARELGAHVTGSDARKIIYTASLERSGVSEVSIGHDVPHVPDAPAEVVFSSAIRPENVERAEARRKGLGEVHRSGLLTEFTALHETVAVFVSEMTVVRPEFVDGEPMRFRLYGETYEVDQPGEHQLHNAALVVEVARARGCAPEDIRAALVSFPGLARRFELRGRTAAGARVYDDYAHHSVEVTAALAAARQVAGTGRVLAVFQPHLFSRTQQFQTEFLDALAAAGLAWVEPVYPARENPEEWTHVAEQLAADVTGRVPQTQMSPGRADLARLQPWRRDVRLPGGAVPVQSWCG